jgi:hypothetical protein
MTIRDVSVTTLDGHSTLLLKLPVATAAPRLRQVSSKSGRE